VIYANFLQKNVTHLNEKVRTFAALSNHFKKSAIMNNLLYNVAVVLILFWAIGFFAYNAGNIIHILLVLAVISVLLRIIQGRKAL
jgi:hypothetical protein